MKVNKTRLTIISILIWAIFITNGTYAATVELTTGKLPDQLQEGKQVDFTIKIKDYEDSQQLMLETNLIPSAADKPLWNFGESESVIDINRYQQKIILNLSSLPAFLNVHVSGKVPEGIDKIKCDDIILNKMHETKLKYYEVRTEEKLVGIESFELIIGTKEDFENTLQKIRRSEFDRMKQEVRNLFYMGVTTEAQNIANEMSVMTWPDSLSLFWIFTIKNSTWLNVTFIIYGLVMLLIGYAFGARGTNDPNNQDE